MSSGQELLALAQEALREAGEAEEEICIASKKRGFARFGGAIPRRDEYRCEHEQGRDPDHRSSPRRRGPRSWIPACAGMSGVLH